MKRRGDWYMHTINHGKDKGWSLWRYGAWWVHGPHTEAHVEWCLLQKYQFGVGAEFGRNGGESDVGLTLHASRLGSLYLRLRAPWTNWARVRPGQPDQWEPRHTGLHLFPREQIWLEMKLEDREGTWTKGQPWWRAWTFGRRNVLGKEECQTDVVKRGMAKVPMPEGEYVAMWKHEVRTWRYARMPGKLRDMVMGPRRRDDWWLEIPDGIPVEGKGENSWDCGMDGLFGCGGTSLESAISNAVSHVLRDRKRYGGPHHLTQPTSVKDAGRRG